MKKTLFHTFTTLAAAALVLGAASFEALAKNSEDGLSLVPPDSAAVAVIRSADLRTNPLGAQLFREFDSVTVDGDAARFLEQTRLRPAEDIDAIVLAGTPPSDGSEDGQFLMVFEGRFEPDRLAEAVLERGAVRKGEYFLMSDKKGQKPGEKPFAVSFASRHILIAGSESAVARALESRAKGGTSFLTGEGLGRHMSRIEAGASAFALVDMTRFPKIQRQHATTSSESSPGTARSLMGVMKSVSLLAVQVTTKGDSLKLTALGLSNDEETRELLEDATRGVIAAWRMAAQEKSPETVSVLRRFKVTRNAEGVQISGTLPAEAVRYLADAKEKKRAEKGK